MQASDDTVRGRTDMREKKAQEGRGWGTCATEAALGAPWEHKWHNPRDGFV